MSENYFKDKVSDIDGITRHESHDAEQHYQKAVSHNLISKKHRREAEQHSQSGKLDFADFHNKVADAHAFKAFKHLELSVKRRGDTNSR